MTKVATYLQEHISGEVTARASERKRYSQDTGILQQTPEIVAHPRNTSDVRKIARFSWQLAAKGHSLPLTAYGAGTDATGAAIGSGIVVDLATHMNHLLEHDPKQQLIRLQPGASLASIAEATSLVGATMRLTRDEPQNSTIGGAVANAICGPYLNANTILKTVDQLEVVLANGEVIQTERVSSRELNRRKGLEGMEGDIYREVDGIIEEYSDVISGIIPGDYSGYSSIVNVKRKDGSFDLAPLFIGSQGTLGIICEMILRIQRKLEFSGGAVLAFTSKEAARDAIDSVRRLHPQLLDYYAGELFVEAAKQGKQFDFIVSDQVQAVLVVKFEDSNERYLQRSLRKLDKLFAKQSGVTITSTTSNPNLDLEEVRNITYFSRFPNKTDQISPDIYSGFHIPLTEFEMFLRSIDEVAKKELISIPVSAHLATGVYSLHPNITLETVSGKQQALKLVAKIAEVIVKHGGILIAEAGEGLIKSATVRKHSDTRALKMFDAIRKVFDPYGTLNPGVKQDLELSDLTKLLKS